MHSTPGIRPCPAPLVHARDAREAGMHLDLRDTAVRIRRGVYTSRARWESLAEWDRYLVRVHALALARPEVVFSHESAAALWGLPLFGHPHDLHIFDARRARSLRYGDVVAHTSVDGRSSTIVGGLHTTTISDTALDLIRCLPPAFALAVADAALRSHPHDVSLEALRSIAAGQKNARGRARIPWVLDRADARSESVGESVSRAVIEWCGFPAPELQRSHVVGHRTYRSDFSWPDARLIGESDGWAKYGEEVAEVARAVRAEKARENALRRAGWTLVRWDLAAALRGSDLRDALAGAGLRPVRRPDTARLHAIAHNPRSR